ncbi:MAG: energy-coupling factor ABC transporter ATP-binding protein [Spirochaetaceae bacterium]|jgi:cobalt/nickel transport system ATP-binding protein|nr:energy-coupling factor ABC transporter ATP-binding protein [Spirochaetaceae bacterium]
MLLDVRGLSALYPGSNEGLALHGVTFSIGEGEKVALIGANGAGKSTLLLSLSGILEASEGKIEVDGDALQKKNLPLIRRKLGLLFQNPDDQLFMPTVYEDVIFGPLNYAGSAAGNGSIHPSETESVDRTACGVLEKLEILHLKDRMSHKLSGGEKRLAALAVVLVMEPRLILMDEPSAFLDPRARRRLVAVLKTLPQAYLIATHDLALALELCDRCLILSGGHLRADGPARDIINDAALLDECGL